MISRTAKFFLVFLKQGQTAKTRTQIQTIRHKIAASIGIQKKTFKINRLASVKVGMWLSVRSGFIFSKNSGKNNEMIIFRALNDPILAILALGGKFKSRFNPESFQNRNMKCSKYLI